MYAIKNFNNEVVMAFSMGIDASRNYKLTVDPLEVTANIQTDMLSTFWELDQIEKGLSGEADIVAYNNNHDCVCENMVNIVEVYNENVSYLNEHIYKDLREEAARNYNLPSLAWVTVADNCNTMVKLADVSLVLKGKITEVYNKIISKNGSSGKLPELKLAQPDISRRIFPPFVRNSGAQTARNKAAKQAREEAIKKAAQTEAATAQTTSTTQTNAAPQTTAVTASVSVQSNVEYGNSLGVCAEPDWDNKPIEFRYEENGWKGEVPLEKKFKFVVLQDGKVLKWEEHENRTLGLDHSFHNRSGSYQVQF
jgi:hypothetical protein